jgi:outer membrane biosynthesis protein TonB
MKFRDIYEGKQIQESPESIVASYKMRAKIQMDRLLALVNNSKSEFDAKHISRQIEDMADAIDIDTYYRNQEVEPIASSPVAESEMKFQALGMAKELHNKLAGLTFIDMLAVMSPDNPAKKEVQNLETAINALTSEVGEFIQKYIPDVADADVGDTEEYAEPEEPEEPKEKEAPEEPEEEKEEEPSKDQKKKIKDNEKEVTESAESAESLEEGSPVQDFKTLMYKTMYGKEYEMAIKVMQDENISAADAAKRFRHVDARALAELFKKY